MKRMAESLNEKLWFFRKDREMKATLRVVDGR